MAANSMICQGIIPSVCLHDIVPKQRCDLPLRTRSGCRGTLLEHSGATSARSRRRSEIVASSASNGGVSTLDSGVLPTGVTPRAVQDNGVLPTEATPRAAQDNDYIGYGRVLADKTFRERFVIRFCEVSTRGKISLGTLSSLLQEAATNHVLAMDYDFSPGKKMNGNITVTTRMHVEVDSYPEWRDLIEIDTWFQPEGKNSVRRDWTVKDVRTGVNIAFATSTWVLMNSQTRRLCKMTEELWQELEPHMMRSPPKWALSEERRRESSTKIAKLGEDPAFKIEGVVATAKDCDMNQHVNNVRYLSWMMETVPEDIKRSHEVSKVTVEYRQEASQGESVDTAANIEKTERGDVTCFTHLTSRTGDRKELNRGRTVWRTSQ